MSTWLGIDIGATAVKVAAVRTAYRKTELVGIASVEIVQVGSSVEAIALGVRAVLGDTGPGRPPHVDAIAIAVEGAKTTVKIVELPASAAKQIGDVLPFELEASLPFDLTEAVFDYRIVTKDKKAEEDKKSTELNVLVAVAKTLDASTRIDLVKSALTMEPERIDVGAFPIANMLPYVPALGEGVVAVVDLGTVSSDIVILSAGEARFARTISLGTKGLPGTAAKLGRELRTTIAAYRAQGNDPPARVLLAGGGAYVSGAEAFLSSTLELPVERLPPPTIDAPSVTPDQAATSARFAKAMGLALGLGPRPLGFNLRKGPLAFERGLSWIKDRIPLLAGLGAVILVSFLFSAWAQLYAKSKERAVLEAALGQVSKEVLGEETTSAARAKELVSGMTTLSDEDPLPHADAFDVMVKLSEQIPQSMTHDIEELDVQKNHVVVHGIVATVADTQTIKANMAEVRCFFDPKITRTTAMVGDSRQKYVLEFDLKCPEDQKGGDKKPAAAGSSSAAPAPGAK